MRAIKLFEVGDADRLTLVDVPVPEPAPGQILVRADLAMPPAAFVLDWGDGSAAFDPNDAAARVVQALDEALAAEGFHAESLNHPHEANHG